MLTVPPITGKAKVVFEVVDVRYPILSVTRLAENGHGVVFEARRAWLSFSAGVAVPLVKMRGF
eukprot:281869-Prorocentrum_lima.AAC.1